MAIPLARPEYLSRAAVSSEGSPLSAIFAKQFKCHSISPYWQFKRESTRKINIPRHSHWTQFLFERYSVFARQNAAHLKLFPRGRATHKMADQVSMYTASPTMGFMQYCGVSNHISFWFWCSHLQLSSWLFAWCRNCEREEKALCVLHHLC